MGCRAFCSIGCKPSFYPKKNAKCFIRFAHPLSFLVWLGFEVGSIHVIYTRPCQYGVHGLLFSILPRRISSLTDRVNVEVSHVYYSSTHSKIAIRGVIEKRISAMYKDHCGIRLMVPGIYPPTSLHAHPGYPACRPNRMIPTPEYKYESCQNIGEYQLILCLCA